MSILTIPQNPAPVAPSRAQYAWRLAKNENDIAAAQRLRFEVFNVELREGLAESWRTGLDADAFDECCDHLLVENLNTGEIVGTYRLQTGALAAANRGYYSEREFDFSPYEPLRCELVELGRACIHKEHRHLAVLHLLWRGIMAYGMERGARFFIGCSSVTSRDERVGAAMFDMLARNHLAPAALQTRPQPGWSCSAGDAAPVAPPPPKLLRTYLAIGAKICGPPAIDREFGTIDFLTLLDLQRMSPGAREHFLPPA